MLAGLLLVLRWITLVLEIVVLGAYFYIAIAWGQTWFVAYLSLALAICLDFFNIVTRTSTRILFLVLVELAIVALFVLNTLTLLPIGWPEQPPWLGLAYVIFYILLGLAALHFVFAIIQMVETVVGFRGRQGIDNGSPGETDPFIRETI